MEWLKDIEGPILAVGGLGAVGAFIDFLIGKAGQAKAKDFLLKWWVRFDDVRWKNFGREEGLLAGQLIERFFGHTIFSGRRLLFPIILLPIFTLLGYILVYIFSIPPAHMFEAGPSSSSQGYTSYCTIFCETKHIFVIVEIILSFLDFIFLCHLRR